MKVDEDEIRQGKKGLMFIGSVFFLTSLYFDKWWLLLIATIFTFLAIVLVPWAEKYEE
jgi:hypothetical protein